jgi:hypothetical protein
MDLLLIRVVVDGAPIGACESRLAGERELGDLGLRRDDDKLAAGRPDHLVLKTVVLDQPSQEREPIHIRLAGLLDEHLQR